VWVLLAHVLLVALPVTAAPLARGIDADRIVVDKSERTLTVFWHGVPLKVYRVALGGDPLGHKQKQGDQRTPEGRYTVSKRLEDSTFHLALHVSYPNPNDRARARAEGVNPGGAIEIHGLRPGYEWLGSAHVLFDWTDGCIAVTNTEIEELWRVAPLGTPVEIVP
jgi:murein L,D-transpeptidase YafK